MLPDFPGLRKDLWIFLREFLAERVYAKMPHLPNRVTTFSEGTDRALIRETGETEISAYNRITGEVDVTLEELPHLTLEGALRKLDGMADQMAAQMIKVTYDVVERGAEQVGNVVSLEGKHVTPEKILEMLDKVLVDFRDGAPTLPILHCPPGHAAAVKQAYEQLASEPHLRARFQQIISDKYEEWRAREASRSLVG